MREKYLAAAVAGALVGMAGTLIWQAQSRPHTWEECFIERMEDVRTKMAGDVLLRYCRNLSPASIQAGKPSR